MNCFNIYIFDYTTQTTQLNKPTNKQVRVFDFVITI